jgi:parallel beta-helix repeat protein/predicted outer membrane repeat protein
MIRKDFVRRKEMKTTKITICACVLLMVSSVFATQIDVPFDYLTIQGAVDAAENGDVVVISAGTYVGTGNVNIDMRGKSVTVCSTDPDDPEVVAGTVIDGTGLSWKNGFVFRSGETTGSKVSGLTVKGTYNFTGGAFACYNNSSPLIENCVITGNRAFLGGGAYIANSQSRPVFRNCTITNNTATVNGGAVYSNAAGPIFENCVFTGNTAPNGGAIYAHNTGNPALTNCTITGNTAKTSGGGIYSYNDSDITLTNCIIYGNTAPRAADIFLPPMGLATIMDVAYSNLSYDAAKVEFANANTLNLVAGNVFDDPLFTGDSLLILQKVSPCVDAGKESVVLGADTDVVGSPRVSGGGIDIGAFEFQSVFPAVFKLTPQTLNLDSNGQFVTCTIAFATKYSPDDIDTSKLLLNMAIAPEFTEVEAAEQYLLVKFDRSALQALIDRAATTAEVSIYGQFNNGIEFEGFDEIKITTDNNDKTNGNGNSNGNGKK